MSQLQDHHDLEDDERTLYESSHHRSSDEEMGDYGSHGVRIASDLDKKRLWWKNAVINICFIASWYIFATILSVYNKWMFAPDRFGFPAPLFVTTVHMFVQFSLAAAVRYMFPRKFRPEARPSLSDFGKKAVPTGITTGVDIGLSNVSLKTITLSFYTMCKSSSLIFVLLFAFMFRLEAFSYRLVGVILLICGGVLLMVASETSFQLFGFILVITASACSGLRWSLTHLLLKNKDMGMDNPAATVFWLAPVMGVSLAIISVFWESWSEIFAPPFLSGDSSFSTLFFLVAPGVVAFCMVLSEFYIIQRAGVLPMSIAGIAKEVTTITISAWVFGDELTPLNITGVGITVCGIALFTYHKYRKSISSEVALDENGNAVLAEGGGMHATHATERGYELEMADRLRRTASLDAPEDRQHLLFSADDLEDDAEELRSVRSSKIGSVAGDDDMPIPNGAH
ncbi:TPT-domain-containing protein [Coniophora puteana RWD-64-598 SS2]|uniref:TPT-domain-containing protein n=1 Tax=Coniophora puteana (strain RWD-64-598) TaxID=741705 RepID=A0A5M3MV76_CONPW|nr:TPT-domain-containing protein [Coniophora puteana RWD-64-598 SS2]EIW82634.1 TPT-domain-containing protein [Coniophora puteana RWD-64-598 SS2]